MLRVILRLSQQNFEKFDARERAGVGEQLRVLVSKGLNTEKSFFDHTLVEVFWYLFADSSNVEDLNVEIIFPTYEDYNPTREQLVSMGKGVEYFLINTPATQHKGIKTFKISLIPQPETIFLWNRVKAYQEELARKSAAY